VRGEKGETLSKRKIEKSSRASSFSGPKRLKKGGKTETAPGTKGKGSPCLPLSLCTTSEQGAAGKSWKSDEGIAERKGSRGDAVIFAYGANLSSGKSHHGGGLGWNPEVEKRD